MDDWKDGDAIPDVKPHNMKEFIVAVFRQHSGKVYSFAASYLNAYPLNYDDCICKSEHLHLDDGCPTTGWFEQTDDDEFAYRFNSLNLKDGDRLMGWREIPQWTGKIPGAA